MRGLSICFPNARLVGGAYSSSLSEHTIVIFFFLVTCLFYFRYIKAKTFLFLYLRVTRDGGSRGAALVAAFARPAVAAKHSRRSSFFAAPQTRLNTQPAVPPCGTHITALGKHLSATAARASSLKTSLKNEIMRYENKIK